MARSKNNQKAAASRVAVDVGATGSRSVPMSAVILLAASILAALWAVAMMTAPGRVGYYYFFIYSEFYMGVLTLVSLSITIMVGVISTDRLVLSIRQRVFLQSTHRTTGVMAISALAIHLWTKTVESHIRIIDIFIPFITPTNTLWIGFGQISGYILVMVTWSGLIRARFIGRGKPWMWRTIHSVSYLMWPIALLHGLGAGRAAKTWVIVSYIVCVLAVLVALAVRLSVSLNRRKDFSSAAGVGAVKAPPSEVAPTASGARNRFAGGGGGARGGNTGVDLMAPAAAPNVQSWVPATPPAPPAPPAPAPVAEVPAASPAPVAEDYPPRGGRDLEPAPRQRRPVEDEYDEPTRAVTRRPREEYYDDEPAPRSRRRRDDVEEDGPRPRSRRFEDDEENTGARSRRSLEETGTRMRRDDFEDTQTRMRRYADDEPAPRSRRAPEPEYDERPRGRRRAEDERYEEPRYEEPAPRQRAARYEDEEPPRARRQSRSEFVDFADDDTPTLVGMESRRSRRGGEEPERGGRRGRDDDEAYFSQLRGER
ncbi:translation initiation factor III [Actinoplanes sp. NPDC051851]|uniref:translation initiation factor III n=1 Tax=Actinoplanes sp. NPDC051851 TaxID=3154753 RepID=UPI0034134A09